MMNKNLPPSGLIAFLWVIAGFLLLPAAANAQEWVAAQAIAMHGTPKYPDNFKHFPYANPRAPKGGSLRLNIVGTFDSLNPYIVKGRAAEGMTYVYETLMARSQDEPFTLYPLIAEKIEVKPDRSAIRFYINPNAHWQDGKPVTADDILFSWQTLRDKGRPNHRTYYKKVDRTEKNGALSVTFYFKPNDDGKIDREMPLIMGLMPVLPQHAWKNAAFDVTSLTPPLASGPYKIENVDAGRTMVFKRDPNYWGRELPTRIGQFNFDTIRYDYYRDENVAQEAFTAHQLDARRETDPKRWAEFQRIEKQKPDGFKTYAFKHQRPESLRALIFNTRRTLFADAHIRQALSYMFDFDWMNRTLFHSAYVRSESYFANSELASFGLPDTAEQALLTPYKDKLPEGLLTKAFSLPRSGGEGPAAMRPFMREAIALFDEAGYKIVNEVMRGKNGEPYTFEILLADPQDEKIALEYSRMLKRIGVATRIRTVDAAQFQSRLNDFDYDMVLYRWVNSLSPGNEQAFYWGSHAADTKGSRNYAGIKNPVVDALVDTVTAAHTRDELVTAIHALDRVLLWNYYIIPLYHRGTDLFAIWQNIATPETVPLYGTVVESWWSKDAAKP